MKRALLALILIATACSADAGVPGDGPTTPVPETPVTSPPDDVSDDPGEDLPEPEGEVTLPGPPSDSDAPPPMVLVGDTEERLELSAISYCWTDPVEGFGVCADGIPVPPYPVLSANRSFTIEWPIDGWVWSVSSLAEDDFCSPSQQVLSVRAGDRVEVPAGARMSIFGRGPGGDAWFVFTADLADPVIDVPMQASIGWAPSGDELPTGSHLWLTLVNVLEPPDAMSVVATVEHDGGRLEIPLTAEWSPDCWTGGLTAFTDPGRQPDDLAGTAPPYTVTITVDVEGRTLTSDAIVWPDDFPDNSDEGPVLTLTEG